MWHDDESILPVINFYKYKFRIYIKLLVRYFLLQGEFIFYGHFLLLKSQETSSPTFFLSCIPLP